VQQAQAQAFEEGKQAGTQEATDNMKMMELQAQEVQGQREERMQTNELRTKLAMGSGI
jgi:hypothetical protein